MAQRGTSGDEASKSKSSASRAKKPGFECTVCLNNRQAATACPHCNVDRVICVNCVREYLETVDPFAVKCMIAQCAHAWSLEDIKGLSGIGTRYYVLFQQRLREAIVAREERTLGASAWLENKVIMLEASKERVNQISIEIAKLEERSIIERSLYRQMKTRTIMEGPPKASVIRCRAMIDNIATEGATIKECSGVIDERTEYCLTCGSDVCLKCGGSVPEDIAHECKPDDIRAFVSFLVTTKACPGCTVALSKSEGCSTMYCTQCHTAFDWETLRIITGTIHNPEYDASIRAGTAKLRTPVTGDGDEFIVFQDLSTNNQYYPAIAASIYGVYSAFSNIMSIYVHHLNESHGKLALVKERFRRNIITREVFAKKVLKWHDAANKYQRLIQHIRPIKKTLQEHLTLASAIASMLPEVSLQLSNHAEAAYRDTIVSLKYIFDIDDKPDVTFLCIYHLIHRMFPRELPINGTRFNNAFGAMMINGFDVTD